MKTTSMLCIYSAGLIVGMCAPKIVNHIAIRNIGMIVTVSMAFMLLAALLEI
jgi:hypothetical protein